jgi:hypothetical protein
VTAVRNLAIGSDYEVALGKAGACEAVTAAMKRHANDAAVALQSCNAVINLAVNVDNAAMLGEAGACEAVTAAMMRHADDAAVAQHCCWAVANLAAGLSANKARLGKAGACTAVVKALAMHGSSMPVEMAKQALNAVTWLAATKPNRGRLGAAGACALVVAAMREHISEVTVAAAGVNAVLALATDSSKNCQKLLAAGALGALQSAMAALSDDAPRMHSVERAIIQLATNAASSDKLRAAGAYKVIVTAISEHLDDVWFIQSAVRAVAALAACKANRPELRRAGASAMLNTAVLKHNADAAIDSAAGTAQQYLDSEYHWISIKTMNVLYLVAIAVLGLVLLAVVIAPVFAVFKYILGWTAVDAAVGTTIVFVVFIIICSRFADNAQAN